MTQHTDEPSVDERISLADAVKAFLEKYDKLEPALNQAFAFQANHGMPYSGENWAAELDALRRALSSRLSHPTLSADRLAEIQKRHDDLCAVKTPAAQSHIVDPTMWLWDAHKDRAELLAAHRADRNAVIEECLRVVRKYGDGGQSPIALIAADLAALKQ